MAVSEQSRPQVMPEQRDDPLTVPAPSRAPFDRSRWYLVRCGRLPRCAPVPGVARARIEERSRDRFANARKTTLSRAERIGAPGATRGILAARIPRGPDRRHDLWVARVVGRVADGDNESQTMSQFNLQTNDPAGCRLCPRPIIAEPPGEDLPDRRTPFALHGRPQTETGASPRDSSGRGGSPDTCSRRRRTPRGCLRAVRHAPA